MTNDSRAIPAVIRVLLADSKPMESQLLAGSLQHQGFQVLTCASEVSSILEVVEHGSWMLLSSVVLRPIRNCRI
jgi:hypothetical protein